MPVSTLGGGSVVLHMLLTESLLNTMEARAAKLSYRCFQLDAKPESLNLAWRVSQIVVAAQWLEGDG